MRSIILCLLSGCATSTAGTIAATVDGVDATVKAFKAVDAGLPASAKTAAYLTERGYVIASINGAVADMPACTSTSVSAVFTSIAGKVDQAFVAFMAALQPPSTHTAARARLTPRAAAVALARSWLDELKHPSTVHTAALSGGDIAGIISAALAGASALIGGGVAIAGAVKGGPSDVATCETAEAGLRADAAGLAVGQ